MIRFCLFLFSTVLLFVIACETLPEEPKVPYNPYDPANPNYIRPRIFLLSGPAEADTITTDTVTFLWKGNLDSMLFRHRFDNGFWSAFDTTTSVHLTNLSEGKHIFFVQGQYIKGENGPVYTFHFYTDLP